MKKTYPQEYTIDLPIRTSLPRRKPFMLRLKMKLHNLKEKIHPTRMNEDNYG